MKNPIFNRQHIKEYFGYGLLAAILYAVPVWFFFSKGIYQDLYFIYIGIGLFMFTIFSYAIRLLNRPYDKKRAVSMLIAGNFATLAGVLIAFILVGGGSFFFQPTRGLLFMIMVITIFGNISVGAFVSVITAYVGKKDQTQDEATHLDKQIGGR